MKKVMLLLTFIIAVFCGNAFADEFEDYKHSVMGDDDKSEVDIEKKNAYHAPAAAANATVYSYVKAFSGNHKAQTELVKGYNLYHYRLMAKELRGMSIQKGFNDALTTLKNAVKSNCADIIKTKTDFSKKSKAYSLAVLDNIKHSVTILGGGKIYVFVYGDYYCYGK